MVRQHFILGAVPRVGQRAVQCKIHPRPSQATAGHLTFQHAQTQAEGSDVDFSNCAGKPLLTIMKIWGLLNTKQTANTNCAVGCEHMFGLLSEGEKVKMLINLSCWKNTLQKRDSEWVTNHKIIIIKKPQYSGDIK